MFQNYNANCQCMCLEFPQTYCSCHHIIIISLWQNNIALFKQVYVNPLVLASKYLIVYEKTKFFFSKYLKHQW